MSRLCWPPILARARLIVLAYVAAGTMVTLRQLFYRLVAEGLVPNLNTAYKTLSELTAAGRREGTFPALVDRTRRIEVPMVFDDPGDARHWLRRRYRIDRTADQEVQIILAVEKDTLAAQVAAWFGNYGLPVVVLRGYGSQTYMDEVAELIDRDPRPTTIVYAGDFDASGEDIERDFRARVPGIDEFVRVAVTPEIIKRFNLPELLGKKDDSRADAFIARHGRLVQVEVEALDPADLRALFQGEIDRLVDVSLFEAALEREARERARL